MWGWQPGICKPENQNFEIEKTAGDIIILHICTMNDNHVMYSFWDMECNRQFFAILDCFLPFYPLFFLLFTPPGPFRRFWTNMWQNECVYTVRHAMVCNVYFTFPNFTTLLKGLCAYTWYFYKTWDKFFYNSLINLFKYL